MLMAKQVMENLSFKEFSDICAYFDLNASTKENTKSLRANGFVEVKPLVPFVKFDVLRIERNRENLLVTCRAKDNEPTTLRWDFPSNVIEFKLRPVAPSAYFSNSGTAIITGSFTGSSSI